ncbi:hypothetical protein TGARI_263630A, partial [Toxoplasma gondii ARI]
MLEVKRRSFSVSFRFLLSFLLQRTTPTLGCIQGKNRDTRLSGAFGGFPVRKQRLSFLSPSAMAHYGLLFARGWFTKSLGATVFGLIGVHQLAKKYYDIPTYRDFNLTNWSYALERENLRR